MVVIKAKGPAITVGEVLSYSGLTLVRARVEHVFQVMKLKLGFVKVRYRGLKKNAHRLFVTCALVNLFMSRRKLLAVA